MTPAEKAKETRAKHKEAQKRKEQDRKETIEKMKRGLVEVLDSTEATPTEKLEASKLLKDLI
jgi:hypothetical protein